MRMPASLKLALPLLVWLAFFSTDASAQMNSSGLFDDVLNRYNAAASGWAGVITNAASWLFWLLVTISMVWTFGMMALRKADIGEFFAELVRFTIFTGFFWWLLTNGPNFASTIYASLRQIAGNATGLGQALSPSGIVDIGFAIFYKVMDQSSVWSPVDSMAGILMAVAILVVLALIGVNMLLLLASGWVLAYGGVFFLGFGGSRWTSDMAINYYKTVLGVAVQIMTMVLLVGIGNDLLSSFYARMNTGTLNFEELGVMLVFCVALLMLVNRVPPLVAGIITGSGIGGAGGIGNFGAGAAIGAAMGAASMAAGAASVAGAAVMGGAASAAGGMSAIKAAFEKAGTSAGGESGGMPMFGGGTGGDSDAGSFAQAAGVGGGGSSAGTSTPLGQAAGFYSSGSSSSSGSSGQSKVAQHASHAGSSVSGSSSKASECGDSGGQAGQGAGSLLAGTAANLAKGIGDVAKAKAASIRDAAAERIADTTGGKIAAAIRASSQTDQAAEDVPSFGGNSLAGADSAAADPDDEVAAFANRDKEV